MKESKKKKKTEYRWGTYRIADRCFDMEFYKHKQYAQLDSAGRFPESKVVKVKMIYEI